MDLTPILTAAIAAAGLSIQAWIMTRRQKRMEDTLGHKNGQGNVVEMLEHLKAWTQRHEGIHEHLEGELPRRRWND